MCPRLPTPASQPTASMLRTWSTAPRSCVAAWMWRLCERSASKWLLPVQSNHLHVLFFTHWTPFPKISQAHSLFSSHAFSFPHSCIGPKTIHVEPSCRFLSFAMLPCPHLYNSYYNSDSLLRVFKSTYISFAVSVPIKRLSNYTTKRNFQCFLSNASVSSSSHTTLNSLELVILLNSAILIVSYHSSPSSLLWQTTIHICSLLLIILFVLRISDPYSTTDLTL